MAEFVFKNQYRKKSYKDLYSIKTPSYLSCFKDENTGRYFKCNDVFLLKKKRNMMLEEFFMVYSDTKKYDLVEFGIPYNVTDNISRIIQKVKRRCITMNNQLLGMMWVFDVGEENNAAHYHFVVALNKINKENYPNELKISFKGNKIHGSYVRVRKAFKYYLQGKEVFERGKRKRVYGNSKRFKQS